MRVLQINSVCGIGSTGRIATDIHHLLIEQGHESYIAYGRDAPINCDNPIKIGTVIDNYHHALITRIFDKHGFGSRKATREFIDKVIELDPDVIHLHNIHGYYINIEILFDYLKIADKPVVWTLHDCWSFTGHCAHFDFAGCDRWKTGCQSCPEKKSYPTSLFMDNSKMNHARKKNAFSGVNNLTIVTPSKWLADLVKQSYLKEYPVKVINNGIDLEVFKPTDSDFRDRYNLRNKFIILGVANVWDRRKGFNYFIELSERVNDDVAIVMVGLSNKQIRNLPNNIIGIARTQDTKELAEIYTAADVFINPTLEEVLGLTNIEALACGTPVITFDAGGSVECVDNKTGVVVEKGKIDNLLNGINKSKKIKRGNCVIRAKSRFEKIDRFREYVNLYSSKELIP